MNFLLYKIYKEIFILTSILLLGFHFFALGLLDGLIYEFLACVDYLVGAKDLVGFIN